jgi:hypothetical protein
MRTRLLANDTIVYWLHSISILCVRSTDRLPTAAHVESSEKKGGTRQ